MLADLTEHDSTQSMYPIVDLVAPSLEDSIASPCFAAVLASAACSAGRQKQQAQIQQQQKDRRTVGELGRWFRGSGLRNCGKV